MSLKLWHVHLGITLLLELHPRSPVFYTMAMSNQHRPHSIPWFTILCHGEPDLSQRNLQTKTGPTSA